MHERIRNHQFRRKDAAITSGLLLLTIFAVGTQDKKTPSQQSNTVPPTPNRAITQNILPDKNISLPTPTSTQVVVFQSPPYEATIIPDAFQKALETPTIQPTIDAIAKYIPPIPELIKPGESRQELSPKEVFSEFSLTRTNTLSLETIIAFIKRVNPHYPNPQSLANAFKHCEDTFGIDAAYPLLIAGQETQYMPERAGGKNNLGNTKRNGVFQQFDTPNQSILEICERLSIYRQNGAETFRTAMITYAPPIENQEAHLNIYTRINQAEETIRSLRNR